MRSRKDSAGGRLRRMSRSEWALRAVASESTDRVGAVLGDGEGAVDGELARPSRGGGAGGEGARGVGGADVRLKRGPISLAHNASDSQM